MTADLSKDRKSFTLKSAEGLAQQLKPQLFGEIS